MPHFVIEPEISGSVGSPPAGYGSQAARVPFCSEGFVYTGLGHHWCPDRPPSCVRMSVRDGDRRQEVAWSAAHFVASAAIVVHDASGPAAAQHGAW